MNLPNIRRALADYHGSAACPASRLLYRGGALPLIGVGIAQPQGGSRSVKQAPCAAVLQQGHAGAFRSVHQWLGA